MRLIRKTPAGLETGASRGPYRYHRPIDNSCSTIDAEQLDGADWRFASQILEDLRFRSLEWLRCHYPELTFRNTTQKPKDAAFWRERGRGRWLVAEWRTAP